MNILYFIIIFSIGVILLSIYQIFFQERLNKFSLKSRNIYQRRGGVEFVRIKIKKNRIDRKSIDTYFNLTNQYISKAKKSIKVVDYLPSNNVIKGLYDDTSAYSDENADYLIKKYVEYYENLERVVASNDKLEYTRISQVSGMYRKDELSEREEIEKAIELMTPTLISHIAESLKIFNKERNKFEFYVCSKPAVLYNFVIIDNKYILSEYPFYNPEGVSFPDEMYVNRRSYLTAQFRKRNKMFDVLMSNKKPIDYHLFKYSYLELKDIHQENEKYTKGYERVNELLETQ